MRETKNNIEEVIVVLDDEISELVLAQEAFDSDERWAVLQEIINKLNDVRSKIVSRFISEISDEFISSPNFRD